MRFRKGDLCVIVNTAQPPKYAGMECTVVGDEDWFYSDLNKGPAFGYEIELSNGIAAYAETSALRLRKPPSYFLGTPMHLTSEDHGEVGV